MSLLDLTLHIWRQPDRATAGKMVTYKVTGVSTHASFLESLSFLLLEIARMAPRSFVTAHDALLPNRPLG